MPTQSVLIILAAVAGIACGPLRLWRTEREGFVHADPLTNPNAQLVWRQDEQVAGDSDGNRIIDGVRG